MDINLHKQLFNNSDLKTFECTTEFETNKSFKILTTFINFYVPLLGMIMIYIKIFLSIKSRSDSELLNTNNLQKLNRSACEANAISSTGSNQIYSPRVSTEACQHQNNTILSQDPPKSKRPLFKKKTDRQYSYRNYRRNGLNQFHIISTLPETSNRSVKDYNKSSSMISCNNLLIASNGKECSSSSTPNNEKLRTDHKFLNCNQDNTKFSPGLKQQIKAAKQLGKRLNLVFKISNSNVKIKKTFLT